MIPRLLLSVLLLSPAALAEEAAKECECLWEGPFTEVQAVTDLVISGEVEQVRGNAVDLQVDSVLRGSNYLDSIRVWMKTAHYCRPEAERFKPGTRWVMALDRIDKNVPGGFNPNTPNVSYGRIGDYQLSACGGYFLSRTEDVITCLLYTSDAADE